MKNIKVGDLCVVALKPVSNYVFEDKDWFKHYFVFMFFGYKLNNWLLMGLEHKKVFELIQNGSCLVKIDSHTERLEE